MDHQRLGHRLAATAALTLLALAGNATAEDLLQIYRDHRKANDALVAQSERHTQDAKAENAVVQTMIIDPAGAELTRTLFDTHQLNLACKK